MILDSGSLFGPNKMATQRHPKAEHAVIQTSHVTDSCPLTKLNGRLHVYTSTYCRRGCCRLVASYGI